MPQGAYPFDKRGYFNPRITERERDIVGDR